MTGMSYNASQLDWASYERDGDLRLGQVLDAADLSALQERIDAIMLGTATLDYDRLLMQLDSADGKYETPARKAMVGKVPR